MYVVILGYKSKKTENVALGKVPKGFPADVARSSLRKLVMLDNAVELADLKSPPGNRLEALKGKRLGQHSMRINDQWRICFIWTENGPDAVEIVDYH